MIPTQNFLPPIIHTYTATPPRLWLRQEPKISLLFQWLSKCESGIRHAVTLTKGRGSGLILRLTSQEHYRYQRFNCSLEVAAGPDMDGVTAVVEHMDLRQWREESRDSHWAPAHCLDYLDVRYGMTI